MKLIIALALVACYGSFQVRAQQGEDGLPSLEELEAMGIPGIPEQPTDGVRRPWSNTEGNAAMKKAVWELSRGNVGEAVSEVLTGVTSTTDTIIDQVGNAALSIVATVVGLVFTPLGLLIGLVLMVLGIGGTVLSVAGTVAGIAGGLCPVAVGMVGTLLETVMSTVGGILGGLGKK